MTMLLGSDLLALFGFGGLSCILSAEGAGFQDPTVAEHLLRISSSAADLGWSPVTLSLVIPSCLQSVTWLNLTVASPVVVDYCPNSRVATIPKEHGLKLFFTHF